MEDAIKEIKKAVKALGYKGKVQCFESHFGDMIVFVNDEPVGIYDLYKHTFVD